MKLKNYPIATAFAGAVAGVDVSNSPNELIGYEGYDKHPNLAAIKSSFKFDRMGLNLLRHAWQREIANRDDTDPRRGIWIGGPKGVGKTVMIEQFFARIGVPVITFTCNRRIPISDWLIKMVPDGEGGWLQIDGPLLTAMREGFPVVLSEPSSMDPADLIAMHDIIDRGLVVLDNGETVQAKRGFHVYATDNSMGFGDGTGAYPALNTMNAATMSRFYKFEKSYPTPDEEVEILQARFADASSGALAKFVGFANAIREPHRKGQSVVTMGTRELIDWVEVSISMEPMRGLGKEPAWVGFQTVMGTLPDADQSCAEGLFQSQFGVDVRALS